LSAPLRYSKVCSTVRSARVDSEAIELRPKAWVVGLVLFLVTWGLTTHGKYSASGDEPHYLMVAQSLLADRDLDLRNNYAQNDGRLFGHDQLEMGPHGRLTRGRVLSTHDIGLPVLLLPAYFVAQRLSHVPSEAVLERFRMNRGLLAYSLVSLCLIAVASAAMTLLYASFARIVGRTSALVVVVAAALSPPILSHSFLVFPEGPALALVCVVVWYCTKRPSPSDDALLFLVAAALGLLPWVHRKYSFFVFGLLLLVLLQRRQVWARFGWRPIGLLAALFVLPQIALHAWTVFEWGSLGGPQLVDSLPFALASLGRGLVGLWIDRTSGLLGYAPLYWILPACCVLTWRASWPFLAAAALLYLPMAAFVDWGGGFSPAARYLVPTIPLALVPIVRASNLRGVRMSLAALLVPQAIIDAVVWQHPRTLWPAAEGANAALERLGAVGRAYETALLVPLRDGWSSPASFVLPLLAFAGSITIAVLVAGNASAATRRPR
jgi:hypothetical protein